jgi:transketolase
MRNEFAQAIIDAHDKNGQLVFITGDLGYMALEKVQEKFGERFINAGVAEQNMVSVAASLAYEGFIPFIYSISPFITLRPYEQLRNDVCLHNLPVKVIANGGGYGYGIMGATHHNIEDIGSMRILPNMKVYVPFLGTDVAAAVDEMIHDKGPNYLRLNIGAKIRYEVGPFAQWRKIKDGDKGVVIGTGPVLENICNSEFGDDLEIWILSIFPIEEIPADFIRSINGTKKLIVMEEHNGECGLRETISYHLMNHLSHHLRILSLSAKGYPSGKYGDQKWHQEENSLNGASMSREIEIFINQESGN